MSKNMVEAQMAI